LLKLIVGIDPGVTVGLAIIGLVPPFGKNDLFIRTLSRKNFSKSEIIKEITKYGEPVIVCTDKKRASDLVRKIGSAFGSKIFLPKEDLEKKLKAKLTANYNPNNIHELDALASALYCFEHIHSKLIKIKNKVKNDIDKDRVIDFVIRHGFSVNKAINLASSRKNLKQKIVYHTIVKLRDKQLKEENEQLKENLSIVKTALERLKEENAYFLKEYERIKKDIENYVERKIERRTTSLLKQLSSLKKENKRLQNEIKRLKEKDNINARYEKIVYVKDMTKKHISPSIKNKIVYVERVNGNIKNMEKLGPKLIITPDKKAEFLITEMPLIIRKLHLKKIGEDYFVKKTDLDELQIKNWFVKWVKKYKERFK